MLLDRATTASTWKIYPPDCLETVTLQSMKSDGTVAQGYEYEGSGVQTDYVIENVRRWRTTSAGEILDSEHELTSQNTQRFTFWREFLDAAGAPTPKVQDFIVDADGFTYKILPSTVEQLFGNCVNVEAVQLDKP